MITGAHRELSTLLDAFSSRVPSRRRYTGLGLTHGKCSHGVAPVPDRDAGPRSVGDELDRMGGERPRQLSQCREPGIGGSQLDRLDGPLRYSRDDRQFPPRPAEQSPRGPDLVSRQHSVRLQPSAVQSGYLPSRLGAECNGAGATTGAVRKPAGISCAESLLPTEQRLLSKLATFLPVLARSWRWDATTGAIRMRAGTRSTESIPPFECIWLSKLASLRAVWAAADGQAIAAQLSRFASSSNLTA